MKQITVSKCENGYIIKLPADRNGYLNRVYQVDAKFLGEQMNENWGVPDATLTYRFKEISDEEYKYIYDDIYIIMKYVDRNYYKLLKEYINSNIDGNKDRMKKFIILMNNSSLLNEFRQKLRNTNMLQYLSILDLFVMNFDAEENL